MNTQDKIFDMEIAFNTFKQLCPKSKLPVARNTERAYMFELFAKLCNIKTFAGNER